MVTATAEIQPEVKGTILDPYELNRMRPAELMYGLREKGYVNRVGDRVLTPDEIVDGAYGYSPSQLIHAMRRNMQAETGHLQPNHRRRLRYFSEVHFVPPRLREKMANYVGVTLLPGDGRSSFPLGTEYWDIDKLSVMTHNTRLARDNGDGHKIDHFDVRIHIIELDRDTGHIYVGGDYEIDGEVYSRTLLSRSLAYEPRSRDLRSIPSDRKDIIDAALSLQEDVKLMAASNYSRQTTPLFPKLFLAFKKTPADALDVFDPDLYPDTVPSGYTAALRRMTVSNVIWWLRRGCSSQLEDSSPLTWPEELQARLRCINYECFDGWPTLSSMLDPAYSDFLLNWSLQRAYIDHEDFYMLPLSMYTPDDPAIKRADCVFANVKDFLGRNVPLVDGSRDVEYSLAKIQVVRLPLSGELFGETSNIAYDFSSAELEREFEMR